MRTSRLAQVLLDLMLRVPASSRHQGAWRIAFSALDAVRRGIIAAFGDPAVTYRLDGKDLLLPLSHELPLIRRSHPGYSTNVARIAAALAAKYPDMGMVDVGANVGDTVAIVRALSTFPILCIDGDPRFFSFLRENTRDDAHVATANCFVGESRGFVSGHIEATGGTGRIVAHGDSPIRIETRTLSSLLEEHPEFGEVKLIKIDTDGFDTRIVKGEPALLRALKPVVFLEYDPYFFDQVDDDGFGIFATFREAGYTGALFFENTGEFLAQADLDDVRLLEDLHQFYSGRRGRRYCDVCLFHCRDEDVMEQVRRGERTRAGGHA